MSPNTQLHDLKENRFRILEKLSFVDELLCQREKKTDFQIASGDDDLSVDKISNRARKL